MKRSEMPPRKVALARGPLTVGKSALTRRKGVARQPATSPATPPKRPTGSTGIPPESRDAVTARSQGVCEIQAPGPCTRTATDWHHRQRRREGDHRPVNGLACCRHCHGKAHGHPELARAFGWIVSAWATPEAVPLMLRGTRWVLLTDGGYVDCEAPS